MPKHKRKTKKNMRGGENPTLDPIQQIQQQADEAHDQVKASASNAIENAKTMASVGDFNDGINKLSQHATIMNNSIVNLGSDVATASYENRDKMMKSLNDSVGHANQGNYAEAVKSVNETKTHMANSVNDATKHMTSQKTLSTAGLGDHASAITQKMQDGVSHYQGQVKKLFSGIRPASGGGYTRKYKSKDPNYRKMRYQIISSHNKYSKYHNRLLKHNATRRSKNK